MLRDNSNDDHHPNYCEEYNQSPPPPCAERASDHLHPVAWANKEESEDIQDSSTSPCDTHEAWAQCTHFVCLILREK